MVYCFTILLPMLGIYLLQKINGWTLRELGKRETLSAIPDYDHELYRMFSDHVPDSSSTLYERNNHSYSALYGYLYQHQFEMENQYSHGQLWYDYRRITLIQFHFPVQSYLVALRFYFTGRNVRFRTNHRPPTYFKRSWRRFLVGLFCGITGILFI